MAAKSSPDERRPLLKDNSRNGAGELDVRIQHADPATTTDADPAGIGAFASASDPDDPRNWPAHFRWGIVGLLILMAFTVTFTCISVVPVASRIASDLSPDDSSSPNSLARVLLVTIWELGEAFGPLLIAPLSEQFGRYPVFNICTALFLLATIASTLSTSLPLFVAARCLTGLAVASNVLNPAVVGDLFPPEQRGGAMSLIMLAPLVGGAVGPAISGALSKGVGWRGVLALAAALAGLCELGFAIGFRETYSVVILRRREARRRREMIDGNGSVARLEEANLLPIVDSGDDKAEGGKTNLWAAIMRPAEVLFGSGVLLAMSLYGSVVFAYFYVLAVTFPDILESIYGLDPAQTGSSFMFFSFGSLFAIFACNRGLDSIYVRLRDANKGVGQPEFRLPLAIVGAITLPLSVGLYGWTAQLRLPLPILLFSTSLIGFTLLLSFLPLIAYVVDAFGLFSASAMTGMIVLRCLMSTFLPLATGPLVEHFGYGLGFTFLCVGCLFLVPVPVLIMKYGAQWRQLSKYTREAGIAQ